MEKVGWRKIGEEGGMGGERVDRNWRKWWEEVVGHEKLRKGYFKWKGGCGWDLGGGYQLSSAFQMVAKSLLETDFH